VIATVQRANSLGATTVNGLAELAERNKHEISQGPPLSPQIEALGIPQALLDDIWMVWCVIDTDNNDDLSCEELSQALMAFGHSFDRFEIEDMLREVKLKKSPIYTTPHTLLLFWLPIVSFSLCGSLFYPSRPSAYRAVASTRPASPLSLCGRLTTTRQSALSSTNSSG